MHIRPADQDDEAWVAELLTRYWGGGHIVAGGRVFDAAALPALVAGERRGLATFSLDPASAELVTLNAVTPRLGIGTALIEALAARLHAERVARLVVHTTNDNLEALRFYQRRGFRLARVNPGAIDRARRLKPSIPATGAYGIAVHDELELVLQL